MGGGCGTRTHGGSRHDGFKIANYSLAVAAAVPRVVVIAIRGDQDLQPAPHWANLACAEPGSV